MLGSLEISGNYMYRQRDADELKAYDYLYTTYFPDVTHISLGDQLRRSKNHCGWADDSDEFDNKLAQTYQWAKELLQDVDLAAMKQAALARLE